MTKQSMTLEQAVQFLQAQQARKRDLIVPVKSMGMTLGAGLIVNGKESAEYTIRPRAHEQMALLNNIPMDYYRRCLTVKPALLATQVNTWLSDKEGSDARMVRLIDSDVRAILSSRYRRVDSLFVLSRALEGLKRTKLDFRIESMDVNDERFHLKAIFPTVLGEPKVGDVVSAGVHVWDDEVGRGSYGVAPFSYRLVCKNGATHNIAKKGRHIGRNLDSNEIQQLSQEAVDADDHALGLKIRDLVEHYADQHFFETAIVEPMRKALGETLAKDASEAKGKIEELAKAQGFAENETEAIFAEFLRANDFSRYGLGQAVGFVSQAAETYERACELEELAGSILTGRN